MTPVALEKELLLNLVVVGGAGHVGLPFGMLAAKAGLKVGLYDQNEQALRSITEGKMPFYERGGPELLRKVGQRLWCSRDPNILTRGDVIAVTIGTPVDQYGSPDMRGMDEVMSLVLAKRQFADTLVLLRSTVFPGTTDKWVRAGLGAVYAPERAVQGVMLEEDKVPQLLGTTMQTRAKAWRFFDALGVPWINLPPLEAELAKLYTNVWRYSKFAVANELYHVSLAAGADHERIRRAMGEGYPRAADLPAPGFTAGPCLRKDALQLAAFAPNITRMAESAVATNEAFPEWVLHELAFQLDTVHNKDILLLGMAFKEECDDVRESLSFKLARLLRWHGASVTEHDPYVWGGQIPGTVKTLGRNFDAVVLCVPHPEYRGLRGERFASVIIDPWGVLQ